MYIEGRGTGWVGMWGWSDAAHDRSVVDAMLVFNFHSFSDRGWADTCVERLPRSLFSLTGAQNHTVACHILTFPSSARTDRRARSLLDKT